MLVWGGPSVVFMRGNDVIKQLHKPNVRGSAGLFFQYNFKKIASLRTSIFYERKGSFVRGSYFDDYGNETGKLTINLNYDCLTFPILVRTTFGKKVQFFLNAGPFLGYLIRYSQYVKSDIYPTATYDVTSHAKRFDAGISTGGGFVIPVKTQFAISFEVRNNLALYNVSKFLGVSNVNAQTNSTNFLFSFTYKLGARLQSDTKDKK